MEHLKNKISIAFFSQSFHINFETMKKSNLIKFSCLGLLSITPTFASSLLLDFVDNNANAAVAAVTDFAANDSIISGDAGATVQTVDVGNFADTTFAVTGSNGFTATASEEGGSFSNAGDAPRVGVPILEAYYAQNNNNDAVINFTEITGVTSGSLVTFTLYSIGNLDTQTSTGTVDYNGSTITLLNADGGTSTSATNTFLQGSFVYVDGVDSFSTAADGATPFTLINGFSITTSPVPEPSSFALIGLASCSLLLRRRRNS